MNLRGAELLDALRYLPSIRSRHAELKGYAMVSEAARARLHPLVSIGRLGRIDQAQRVLATIGERVGPCFLDLNTTAGQACAEMEALCDPADNYAAWRELAASVDWATPVALLRDGATERPFIRQVLKIEEHFGAVVVRSRNPAQELPSLQAALSAVDDVNNLLIVLDFGYVRGALEPRTTEARRVISSLRTTDPSARVAVLGSSFPRSISVYGDQRGALEIVERELHYQIGGDEVALYGDHASIYPEPFEPTISRWVPRVDYCLDYVWNYQRRRDDDGGYVECARQIVASEDWDEHFADRAWGADIIRRTARNGACEPGFGAPANWIAARVNMHIERQIAISTSESAQDDVPEDEEF